jgi:hypothetical protein
VSQRTFNFHHYVRHLWFLHSPVFIHIFLLAFQMVTSSFSAENLSQIVHLVNYIKFKDLKDYFFSDLSNSLYWQNPTCIAYFLNTLTHSLLVLYLFLNRSAYIGLFNRRCTKRQNANQWAFLHFARFQTFNNS